jgi:hypothetical protein
LEIPGADSGRASKRAGKTFILPPVESAAGNFIAVPRSVDTDVLGLRGKAEINFQSQ